MNKKNDKYAVTVDSNGIHHWIKVYRNCNELCRFPVNGKPHDERKKLAAMLANTISRITTR